MTFGDSSEPLGLLTYFHDPDDDPLTYTVVSSDPNVATAQRVGSQLTIWTLNVGNTTVTVRATDPEDLFTTQTFNVTVNADGTPDETSTQRPIPQGLNIGDSVIVQNTGSVGLNVRSDPEVRNQNLDNRIGKVYDGATGTIRNGPEPDTEGRTWWEIEWDVSDKVQWQHQPTNQRGWSVEAIGEVGLLACQPSEPVTQAFDLEIQPLSVSKQTLNPGESFTLSITIHNNGPGDSPGPALTYYHSLDFGFSPTDPPQRPRTVLLRSLASGESRTRSFQLVAPLTPKTYYYGAWLAANTGDTNFNNDVATEVGVTVIEDTISDPIDTPDLVDTSDPPDLVITNISVDYDTMYPEERFTVSAIVENAGGKRASNVRLRFYRSSDATYSKDDVEIEDVSEFIGGLDTGVTEDEDAHFDALSEPGNYYYIVRAEPVRNEVDTDNNYAAIKITVLSPAAPDLVVSLTVAPSRRIVSLAASEYLIDSEKYFRLDAFVENQGKEESEETAVHFYQSTDPIPSSDDIKIETEEIKALRRADSRFYRPDEESRNGPASELPGTYYYYACVDSVPNERNTDNNCSNVVTINVRGPDLVVNAVSVDYFSRTHTTVRPDGIFELEVSVRNQGTDDADDSTLRYYISSDAILSADDTEVATNRVFSLDENETSKTYKSDWIRVPYTSGFFYAFVCVDGVEDETDTNNNCYAPIKLTVRNYAPRAEGTIPAQTLSVGTLMPLDVSAYFADTNNDALTYTASSSAPNIATVAVSGVQVTITPQRIGSATVTVTASDGEFTVTQTFTVSIEGEEGWMPDANLRRIVRTALGLAQNDALTQQAMEGLIILNAASSTAGTGVQNLTGLEHATQLTILNLGRTGVRDLTPLQELTQLTQLNLIYTEISDLTPLQELTNLTHLDLLQTRVRNISPIQGLNNLITLNLERLNIRDLTPLQGLTALTSLNLSFNNLTDLTLLSGLTALTSLSLGHTTISDITPLGGLTALTYLDLKNNQISDISPVSGLTQLVTLYLDGNQINDASPLETLTSLKFLRLQYNPIADTAPLQRLKEKNPNVSIDVDIETQSPDLFVDSVRVNKTTVAPSETFRLDAVIKNGGEADASGITLRYYQSADESISTTDTELKTGTIGMIAVDGLKEPWSQLTAPDTPGIYYYGICVDEVEHESNTTNNCSTGVAVTVLGADLVINSVRVEKPTVSLGEKSRLTAGAKDRGEASSLDTTDRSALSTVAPGDQFRLNVSIQNRGKANSTATTLRYYLSADETITSEDMEVHTATLQSIAVEAMREPSVQLTAPDTPGTYYYGVCVDEVAGESDTTNNCSTAVAVTVENTGSVDFVVESINANKTTVKPGENFHISVVIGNQGEIDATATVLRFYLSTDETISTADTEVHTATLPIIGADATRQQSRQFTAHATPGTYYYGVCVDTITGESDTANNCSVAVAVTVGGADLMIDSTPQVSKTTLSPGETFQINTRVWNQGSATSETTTLRYYLSTDDTISVDDTEVDSERVDALSGKGAHASRRRMELSKTLTVPDTPGDYYYGVCVDAVVGDADITNNCSQAIAITVEAPPPEPIAVPVPDASGNPEAVEIQGPDLVFSMTRVDASTIKPGQGVRLHITIENQGTSAAPATMIRYYRSTDATITAEDTELRAVPVGQLGSGKSQTTWGLLPSPFAVGVYYYGACVDGVASEFDTTNNCSDAIEITVEARGTGKPQLSPVDTISTQALEVSGSPMVLNVSGYFFGEVETWTASSNKTDVVTVSISGSEVTLTPVGEGWATVTVTASSGDLAAKQTFSVSVGGAAVPEPEVGTPEPEVEGPDTSPEVSIPDANLRAAVRRALGLEEGDTLTQQKMAGLTDILLDRFTGYREINNLTGLEHATNLTWVGFNNTQVSDITPLANLTNLTALRLWDNQISDITPLANLTNLTFIEMGREKISNISPLANLTNLTLLYLHGNQISDITPLQNLTALTRLYLNENQISDITPLQNLTALTDLRLPKNKISDISAISNLTALQRVLLQENQISDITPLQNLTNLRFLELNDNQISDISALANLTALSGVFLQENQISDIGALANLTSLFELSLDDNQISDISVFANLLVTHLHLAGNQISDISSLADLTTTSSLWLGDNQISNVTPLENLTSLWRLYLSGNPIEDLAPLRRLKEKNSNMDIDIDINADLNNAPTLPSISMLPDETALLSNYPNPFNPETWIPYQLSKPAYITLIIYDVRGVMV